MITMTQNQFFEVLGYLTSPARMCKLDAEMLPRSQVNFETKYNRLSRTTIIAPNSQNYFLLNPTVDKWGVELRIYFAHDNNIPNQISRNVVRPRNNHRHNARINENSFIWKLIEHGFLLGDNQNVNRIRSLVPASHLADFNRGYSI